MRLVYVCAAHSCGKTTLLDLFGNYLSRETNYTYERNPSPRTLISTDKLYTGVDDLSQSYITFGILSKILSCSADFYITDRYFVDNIAYSTYGAWITPELMEIQYKFLNYFSFTLKTSVFYLPPEIPLEGDGVRPADLQFRENIDTKIQELLPLYFPQYITLKGNPQERLTKLISYLKNKDLL